MSSGQQVYRKLAIEALMAAIDNNERWASATQDEIREEAERYLVAAEREPS